MTVIKFYDNADGQLYFYLMKPSIADTNAVPFEFDGPATAEHIKTYEAKYNEYLASKEVLPPSEIDLDSVQVSDSTNPVDGEVLEGDSVVPNAGENL